ncbi:MAG TPA: FAD-dependent oxidoreductase [Ktedonosporobacter sp.]|nr:FAD-dependent oxidoreductase [Ktedonosporobacter sp.]
MAHLERILIVGGGIAGLTLARALHQQGFRAELVERSPSWQATGAAIQLHANGMRILHALGLGKEAVQAGAVVRHWIYCDQGGEVLCQANLGEIWGKAGSCIAIDRPRLQKILLAGATAVPYRLDTSVTSLMQDEQRVQVGFSDGSSSDYDLVVGADGISSTVRTLLMGTVPPDYTGLMIWRSLVPIRPPDPENFRILFGEGCFFGITPLLEGPTNVFGAVGMPRTHDPLPGRLERFRKQFADFGGHVQECLAAISRDEQIHCGPSEVLQPDHWHHGHIVLIGDAAHAAAPTMAQGGCMAMEDAYVLAEILHGAETIELALSSYETRRKPRATWVQQHSRIILESYLMPPAERNPAFRGRGNQAMHDSFTPLIPPP